MKASRRLFCQSSAALLQVRNAKPEFSVLQNTNSSFETFVRKLHLSGAIIFNKRYPGNTYELGNEVLEDMLGDEYFLFRDIFQQNIQQPTKKMCILEYLPYHVTGVNVLLYGQATKLKKFFQSEGRKRPQNCFLKTAKYLISLKLVGDITEIGSPFKSSPRKTTLHESVSSILPTPGEGFHFTQHVGKYKSGRKMDAYVNSIECFPGQESDEVLVDVTCSVKTDVRQLAKSLSDSVPMGRCYASRICRYQLGDFSLEENAPPRVFPMSDIVERLFSPLYLFSDALSGFEANQKGNRINDFISNCRTLTDKPSGKYVLMSENPRTPLSVIQLHIRSKRLTDQRQISWSRLVNFCLKR